MPIISAACRRSFFAAQFFSKRTEPLTIAGPHQLNEWFVRVVEAAFPGASSAKRKFDIELIELTERQSTVIDGVTVKPFLVNHGNPGGPFFAYRFGVEGKTIAYTGDTEWDRRAYRGGQKRRSVCRRGLFSRKESRSPS